MRSLPIPAAAVLFLACGGSAPPPPCPCATASAAATAPATATATATASASASATATASAPARTAAEAVERFFTAKELQESQFSPDFLAAVPLAAVVKLREQVAQVYGRLRAVRGGGPEFEVELERGTYSVLARIDAEGRFTTLRVSAKASTLEDALAGFRKLPGKVSVLVLTDGKERAAIAADEPLAVGSAFKLSILAALRAQVDAKKHRWSETVELDPAWKSLPSGKLQDFPPRAPLTLHTMASLMISISDNTATDALLAITGRTAVEAEAPPRARPMLSTGDMFKLKAKGADALLERWRKGDEKARRQLVAELAKLPLPSLEGDDWTTPRALDVEWLYTTRETCALMAKVHDLPLMGINPGVARKADWDRIAYKGGSEPGVMHMTSWVEKNGKAHCVSATWNDASKPVDQSRFALLVEAAIGSLAKP